MPRVAWLLAIAQLVLGCDLVIGIDARELAAGEGGHAGDGGAGTGGVVTCDADLDSDPDNCGRCGRSCFGARCGFGMCEPETLNSEDLGEFVYQLGIDETHVYLGRVNLIQRIRNDGGDYQTLCAGPETSGLVVQGDYVYLLGLFSGTVERVPKVGAGSCQVLANVVAPLALAAADAEAVYFTNHHITGYLAKVDVDGGTVIPLEEGSAHTGLALDATHVFWVGAGDVRSARKDGGELTVLVPGARSGVLAVDETHVYFTSTDEAQQIFAIRRVPKAGGASETLWSGPSAIGPMVIDAGRVYWRTSFEGTIRAMNKDGSDPTVLAELHPYPSGNGLTIDDGFVYWVGASNRLYRTPK
jgi:hypothetical protein